MNNQLSSGSITEETAKANELERKKMLALATEGELKTKIEDLPTESAQELIGSLTGLATAALEKILRNPTKHASQVVQAAKLVYERKLGAIPDTVIQNNTQFIVKWQD